MNVNLNLVIIQKKYNVELNMPQKQAILQTIRDDYKALFKEKEHKKKIYKGEIKMKKILPSILSADFYEFRKGY